MGTHLDRVSRRAMRENVPFSVMFEITGRCNLDCQHCYLDIRHPPDELSTAEIFSTLEQLADAGTFYLTITGGEVMLRKDLLPILRRARELGFALRLYTSGTRMTWSIARELAKLHLVAVEMSLYGTRCHVHDTITQRPGSHRKTLRAALMLKRLGVEVVLKSPILSPLEGDHGAFLALAERVGAVGRLDPAVMVRRDGDTTPTGLRASTEALAKAFREIGRHAPGTELPPPVHPNNAPCAVGRRTALIAPDGNVFPCATYPHPVGNLRERSLRDIWWGDSPLLARLRALTQKDVGSACGTCSKSGYCGRCLALALIEHGDEKAPLKEACRVAHAKDLAVENGAPLPPGLVVDGARSQPQRRRLPLVG
jgi:radical SAM protein with 4Fe4S-binding SPASM domain